MLPLTKSSVKGRCSARAGVQAGALAVRRGGRNRRCGVKTDGSSAVLSGRSSDNDVDPKRWIKTVRYSPNGRSAERRRGGGGGSRGRSKRDVMVTALLMGAKETPRADNVDPEGSYRS